MKRYFPPWRELAGMILGAIIVILLFSIFPVAAVTTTVTPIPTIAPVPVVQTGPVSFTLPYSVLVGWVVTTALLLGSIVGIMKSTSVLSKSVTFLATLQPRILGIERDLRLLKLHAGIDDTLSQKDVWTKPE